MAKIVANLTGDFAIMANQDVSEILNELNKAEGFQRERLITRASELHKDEQHTEDYLAGYADQMIKSGTAKGTAKVRKAEARVVFKAMHALYLKSNLDTDEARQDEALATLNGLDCGFHAFIEKCREFAASGETTSGSSREGTVKKVQSEDVQKFAKRLEVSGASAALETTRAGLTAYIKQNGTPIGLVRNAEILAFELSKSSEPYYKKLGETMLELCGDAIARDEKAQAKATEKVVTPAPAQAEGSQEQAAV